MTTPRPSRHLTRTFLAGLLAALPLVATVGVFVWLAQLIYGWLGPQSLIGGLFVQLGLSLSDSERVGYGLGVLIILAAIYALGLLVEAQLQAGLARVVNLILGRIPVVRNVYDLISRFVDMLGQRDAEGLKSMSAVWVTFGGPGGIKVLGLLSTPEAVMLDGQPHVAVIVPTAPVPVGGGLLYVPQSAVTSAEVGMDAVTSIYVSMGVTSGQHLSHRVKDADTDAPR
jgi:uncharacterized membrane protein